MRRAYALAFRPSPQPCGEFITKFGGQPVWLQQPAWPISQSTGEPMRFICQIALYPEIFGNVIGRMAYVFMTDLEKQVVPAWDPDSGENAIVIQPGAPCRWETREDHLGPTIYEYVEVPGDDELHARSCEYLVDVFRRTDPEFVNETVRNAMDEPSFARYSKDVEGNKIGGTPGFLQEDALPGPGHLLLQLDSRKVPFYLNFGDSGVGYAFISPDGTMGKFLFQSY